MSIESNASEIIAKNLKMFKELQEGDKILRAAALDTVAVISFRVQQQGTNVEGQKMESKSPKKFKAYSYYYGKEREASGFQTEHIDLTVTGGLMDSLWVEPDGQSGYIVGLRGDRAAKLSEYQEERFGTIFQLNEKELDTITQQVIDSVNEVIRRNS